MRRNTRSSARIYRHPDGRMAVVHYHRGGDTLSRGTLGDILSGTQWSEEDLRRLGLL